MSSAYFENRFRVNLHILQLNPATKTCCFFRASHTPGASCGSKMLGPEPKIAQAPHSIRDVEVLEGKTIQNDNLLPSEKWKQWHPKQVSKYLRDTNVTKPCFEKNKGNPRTQKQTARWRNQMCPAWIMSEFTSFASAASPHGASRGHRLGARAKTLGNHTEQAMLYSVLLHQHGFWALFCYWRTPLIHSSSTQFLARPAPSAVARHQHGRQRLNPNITGTSLRSSVSPPMRAPQVNQFALPFFESSSCRQDVNVIK